MCLCLSPSVSVSVSFSVCLCLSFCLASYNYLSTNLPIYLPIYLIQSMHPPSVHPSISSMHILPENQPACPLIVSNSWFKKCLRNMVCRNVFTKESAAASAFAPLSCLWRRLVKIILAPRKKESSSSQIYYSTAHLQKPIHRSNQTTKRFSKHFEKIQKVWKRSKVFVELRGIVNRYK